MYAIKVEDKYYVEKVIIGTDDEGRGAFVGISEDIDDALLFDELDGWFVIMFLRSCDGDADFKYVEVNRCLISRR